VASVLSRYVVLLEAQSAKYQRELEGAQKKLQKFEKQNKKSLGLIKAGFAAFGIGLGVREIARFVGSVTDAAIKMQQFERALKVATGSAVGSEREMAFVRKTADDLGLSLESTAGSYAKLAAAAKGTTLAGEASRDIFVGVSQAARVLGLTAEQTGGALTAIEQIISKGKVSAEELRGQLGERLPGAFQIAARSIGVTTAELDKMLKAGELTAEDLLPALAKELTKTFGPEVAAAANDAQASINRFSTAIFELKVAIAESGLLDNLTALAKGGTAVAQAFGAAFFGANPFPFEKEIVKARDELEQLQTRLAHRESKLGGFGGWLFGENPDEIRARIAEVQAELSKFQRLQEQSFGLGEPERRDPAEVFGSFDRTNSELDTLFESHKESFQKFIDNFATAEQKAAALRAELNKYKSDLSPEEFQRISDSIKDTLSAGLEEIEISVQKINPLLADMERYNQLIERNRTPREEFDRAVQSALILRERLIEAGREEAKVNEMIGRELRSLADAYEAKNEEASKAEEAARDLGLTFTSAFEDAIVEGNKLSDVLRGLYKDLLRLAIRKLITEPFLNFFGGLFKPETRHSGGPVTAGTPYLVRPDEEIFVPRSSGHIVPNGAGGAVIQQTFNVQVGLPPQWQAQLAAVTQLAASKARQDVEKSFGGRR
jgi:tape measure domain-containing protein